MGRVEGYVEHIRFRNPDNGYTVLTLDMSDDEETLVGIFNYINEGEYIGANGEYVDHPVHGPQFQVSSYEILEGMKVAQDYKKVYKKSLQII